MSSHDSAVAQFGNWLRTTYQADAAFDSVEILTGEDASNTGLIARLPVGNRSYYEVRVVVESRELQVGFATEGRMINEAIEQMVLDNGGDLSEILADELSEMGQPPLPMDHFFERPAFRYIVRQRLKDLRELEGPEIRKRVQAVLKSSQLLFQSYVDAS
jgi:hypothetical protein